MIQPRYTRIDLHEMKSQITRKLGPELTRQYFGCLNQLLSHKLSKQEFNKFCLLILGRELIPLHNQLIRSILKNAFQAKTPPPLAAHGKSAKHIGDEAKKFRKSDDGFGKSRAPLPPVWYNGSILPPSPRKSRSSIRDRRTKDRHAHLSNGRADATSHHSLTSSDAHIYGDNGIFSLCDLEVPGQDRQDWPAEQPAKRHRTEHSLDHDWVSLQSKISGCSLEMAAVGDKEDLVESSDLDSTRGPLQAPLGIPFCQASLGGARRVTPLACSINTSSFTGSRDCGKLCDTEDLRIQMEKIAEAQGLAGVNTDCANLLYNGLDAYLKRLIKSCIELVGARSGHKPIKQPIDMQHSPEKPISGVWPGNHMLAQSTSRPLKSTHGLENTRPISLHDFQVGMELNPQQLGEDWPFLLERIRLRSFEE